jgi:hypothetical protein
VFIYSHDKDLVERALINLGTARIELNDEDPKNGTRVMKSKLALLSLDYFVFSEYSKYIFRCYQKPCTSYSTSC